MTEVATPLLSFSVADGVARLRFSNPTKLNALDPAIADGLNGAVDRVLADPAVRVVLLSGEGRAFMAGGDLSIFAKAADKAAAFADLVERIHTPLKKLEAAPLIVIAAVQGAIAGAGMAIALGADLCVAAEDARFTFAYSAIGAPGDCGVTWALPRLVGYRRALEIALLSDPVPAARALELGLVNRVVPLADLEREAGALAARIAAGAPLAAGSIKRLLRAQAPYATQLDAEAAAFTACAGTADFAEGVAAFFAKRRPTFTGA